MVISYEELRKEKSMCFKRITFEEKLLLYGSVVGETILKTM